MSSGTKIRVVEKRLGRERAMGQAIHGENVVEVDPRQHPREYLDTVIHEVLHLAHPDFSERQVCITSRKISTALWRLNYRRVTQ